MAQHMLQHTGFKHKCTFVLEDGNVCGKLYRAPYALKHHINVDHKNILPFSCDRCGKEFTKRLSWREHILADHLNLQLDCLIAGCRTKFRTVRALVGHLRVVHRELTVEEKVKYVKQARKIPLPKIK
jgi:hypothetical protein